MIALLDDRVSHASKERARRLVKRDDYAEFWLIAKVNMVLFGKRCDINSMGFEPVPIGDIFLGAPHEVTGLHLAGLIQKYLL